MMPCICECDYVPYTLYEQCVGSFTSGHRIYYKACETGCEVYHPYPKKLESPTICRCYYVGSVFSSVIRPFQGKILTNDIIERAKQDSKNGDK